MLFFANISESSLDLWIDAPSINMVLFGTFGIFGTTLSKKVFINADVNGAINIMRKELAVYPVQLNALKKGMT